MRVAVVVQVSVGAFVLLTDSASFTQTRAVGDESDEEKASENKDNIRCTHII